MTLNTTSIDALFHAILVEDTESVRADITEDIDILAYLKYVKDRPEMRAKLNHKK